MALLTAISSDNCVISQGASYAYTIEPTVFESWWELDDNVYRQTTVVRQWRVSCTLSASYYYGGLTEAAAKAAAANVEALYVQDVPHYAPTQELIIDESAEVPEGYEDLHKTLPYQNGYHYISAGDVPKCGARVNAVHESETMWRVDVEVGVEVTAYLEQTTSPTNAQLKGLGADFLNADTNVELTEAA